MPYESPGLGNLFDTASATDVLKSVQHKRAFDGTKHLEAAMAARQAGSVSPDAVSAPNINNSLSNKKEPKLVSSLTPMEMSMKHPHGLDSSTSDDRGENSKEF